MASTSEVYGDPLVHPQTEEYWGNVNPIGSRSVPALAPESRKDIVGRLGTNFEIVRGVTLEAGVLWNDATIMHSAISPVLEGKRMPEISRRTVRLSFLAG